MGKRAIIYTIDLNDDDKILRQKINSNFENLNHQATVIDTTGGGGSHISTHHQLPDVTLADCHPIEAITELSSRLNTIDAELDDKYDADDLPSDLLAQAKKLYPKNFVISTTASSLPSYYSEIGTWTKIGSQEIGSKTVNYFERTA